MPQVGQALITEVVAPTANASFGAPLPLTAAAAGSDQPVLALDRGGHIVLAAMATGTVAAMDADSTALALVRLAFGALPADRSAAAFNADIRATASFVVLSAAVQQALAAGQPPGLNPEVQQHLMATQSAIGAQAVKRAAAGSLATKRALATLPTPWVEDLEKQPYKLVPDLVTGSVFVASPEFTEAQLGVVNATPLYWSVTPREADGRSFPSAPASSSRQLLQPMDLGDRLLGNLDGRTGSVLVDWLTRMEQQAVAVPQGRHFQLLVAHDRAALYANLLNLLFESVALGFPLAEPQSCREALGQVLLTSELQGLLVDPTSEQLVKYFETFFTSDFWSNYLNVAQVSALRTHCFPGSVVGIAQRFLTAKVKFLVPLMSRLNALTTAVSMVSLIDRTIWTVSTVGKRSTVGLCADATRIVNCATRFAFQPAQVVLAPGAEYTAQYDALDRNDQLTGVPTVRTLSLVPPVPGFEADTGKFTASGFAEALELTVKDPATGATGTVRIDVVAARIDPPTAALEVGQQATFALRDAQGRLVQHPPSVAWSVVPEGVALLEAPVGPWAGRYPDVVQLRAARPGRAELQLSNPADPRGQPLRTQLTVQAGPPGGTVVSSPNPSAVNAVVRFLVALVPVPNGPGVPRPSGRVSLRDKAGAALCDITLGADGTGQCDVPLGGPVRRLQVVADYAGDGIFQPLNEVAVMTHSVGLQATALTLLPPASASLGDVVTLGAVVRAGADAPAGQPVPGGQMQLAIGAQRCTATLFAQADGSAVASCLVQVMEQGPRVPLEASYGGDALHAAATGSSSAAVARGRAVVQAEATPTTVTDGTPIGWRFSVSLPGLRTVTATGRVTVRTSSQAAPADQLLCETPLDGTGAGSCTGTLHGGPIGSDPAGPVPVVVSYSGDAALAPAEVTLLLNRVRPEPSPGQFVTRENGACQGDNNRCTTVSRVIHAFIYCEARHLCLQGAKLRVKRELLSYPNGVRTTELQEFEQDADQMAYEYKHPSDTTPGLGFYLAPVQPAAVETAYMTGSHHRSGFTAYSIRTDHGLPGYEASAVTIEVLGSAGVISRYVVDARRSKVQDCSLFEGPVYGGAGQLCVEALPYP